MCSVILLVQRFWEHYIPINLAKQLSCAQIWTHFQSKMPKMYPTAHKFQVSVMPAAIVARHAKRYYFVSQKVAVKSLGPYG